MKLSGLLSVLVIFFSACINNNSQLPIVKENKLILRADEKGNYSFTKNDTIQYTLIEVRLINESDSEFSFIANNCGTGANIITNLEHVKICPNQCPTNFPKHLTIMPGQEFSIPVVLQIEPWNYKDINSSSIKIGLILIPPDLFNGSNYHELLVEMMRTNEHIIWCDLNNIGGDPYVIK